MNIHFTRLIQILVSLISLTYTQSKTCPSLTTNYIPMTNRVYSGYNVRSFLKIPNTNILLINTLKQNVNENASIVYYNNMISKAGEIINVIRPEYIIVEMYYIYPQDKILAMNYERLIVANPYTLKSERYISLKSLVHVQILDKTKYAIATLKNYIINIIDTDNMVVITSLDNTKFPNVLKTYNFYTKYFSRSVPSQYLLITVNSYGFYSWSLDLKTFAAKYNGYIGATIVNSTDFAYRQFTKHPSKDIFFVGGYNLEILAFEIVDINTQSYRTQMKLNLYDSKYLLNIINIVYKDSTQNSTTPLLIVGDGTYIYDLVLNQTNSTKITIPTYTKPPYYQDGFFFNFTWYEIPESSDKRIVMAANFYFTLYDYYYHTYNYNLFFGSDLNSRRFMYEDNGVAWYVVLREYTIQYFDKTDFVENLFSDSNMKTSTYSEVNNFYRVKNCEECLIIKMAENSTSHFMQQSITYPKKNTLAIAISISSLGFLWDKVNLNLDPFYYKNQTWVVFGFRSKPSDKKFLFTLINMQNKTQNVNLTGATDEENNRQSSYAIAAVDDPSNLEIIGVDLLGYIYVWDFLSPLKIKYSRKTSYNCLNSDIGTIYQYNKKKWLILACDDMKILSYDFENNITSVLRQISSNPLSLKAFPSIGIITIGDTLIGDTYIYKFQDGIFTYFLTILAGYLKDRVISVELFKDNKTLWIQYDYSNLLYQIGDCINDVKDCQNCQQTYYFNTNYTFDTSNTYGNGTLLVPYTSPYNFLTSMLLAQRYQDRISGTTNMNVNILIDPQFKMNIPKEYLNFDFSQIIQLTIKSKIQNQIALFEYADMLEFSKYNYIGLQDIGIQFYFTRQPNQCGINFYKITENVTLNNIQLFTQSQTDQQLNCFQISADQTNLKILEFQIKNQNFTSHKYIFSTIFIDWIDIQNLSLENCILGDNFSIVMQKSNLIAEIKTISIINNICSQNFTDNVSSLFSAGQFSVENILIKNNSFCNKIIFSSVPSLQQLNYKFKFKKVQVIQNSFVTKTLYLFFNSLYSMKYDPSHSATFLNMVFENNILQKMSQNDLMKSSFIQTSKISNHIFEDINFKNHHEISFASIEYSNKVQFTNFYCENDKEYLDLSPNTDSGSCLQLNEIQSTQFKKIRINYKKAINNELINLQNKLFHNISNFDVQDGEFSNMILKQQTINSFANPISVIGQNYIDLTFSNCHFFDNSLDVIEGSQTFSSSAIFIQDSLGTVNIENSSFKNSISNSIHNFIFIESNWLKTKNLTFSNSSFEIDTTKQLGGFMHLILKSLKIVDSSFSKSISQYGSFIYLKSFGNQLNIDMSNSHFSEGYSVVDGGALYIQHDKSLLKFTCTDCFFDNIYVYSLGSSVIGFQKYRITTEKVIHEMTYQGGHIKNIFGIGDNFFTDIYNMKLSFIDIKDIQSLIPDSEEFKSLKNLQFGEIASQQSTLLCSQYSEINIQGCNISNYQILNQNSNQPLLLNSEFTSVSIIDTNFTDGIFIRNAISITNGTLSLSNTIFTNIVQLKRFQRLLSVNDKSKGYEIQSLIVMKDSGLIVSKETSFLNTKCYNNCTGAVFHLENTNFQISDMSIFESEAAYGGSIFIQGLQLQNEIISSKFVSNRAQVDGGAIYIQALMDDIFSFKIQNCNIISNNAVSGKGGAIFIRSNSQNSTNQLIEVADTELIGNIAQIGGGIYQKEISAKILGNTVFKENIGKDFGNDSLSYPTHLRLTSMNKFLSVFRADNIGNDTIYIQNFRSGNALTDLSFELVNDQNEVIRPMNVQELQEFSVSVQISKNEKLQNYSIRGNVSTLFDSKSKQFTFSNFDFIGIPGSQATLQFFSNQIYILDKNKVNQYNQDYTFNLIINFRECIQGETILIYNQLTECKVCQEGRYSFDLQECYICPTGATCPGGAEIITNPGYWRKTNESAELVSCSLSENCQGGSFGNNVCFEGHIGALCEECDITGEYWNGYYSKTKKNSCTNCNQIIHNTWFVFLVTLWTLVSMALAIRSDIQDQFQQGVFYHVFNLRKKNRQNSQQITQSQMIQQNNQQLISNSTIINNSHKKLINSSLFYQDAQKNQNRQRNSTKFSEKISLKSYASINKQKTKSSSESERSGIFIKILTNYLQIVSSIASFNLKIPSGIFEFPQLVGQPLEQTMSSLDCILKEYKTTIPFIYLRLMSSFLLPIGYFIIFILCLGIIKICKRKGKFPWYILSSAAMFLIIYCQPDLVSQMIALMSCRQIGETKYILANVAYECYTSTHSKYVLFLIGPLLAIWVLVIPLILFLMIYKNKENLDKIKIKLRYGLLYKEYKKEAFYWEFVKMVEKICIILCLNFYSTNIIVKALLVYIVIVIYGILSIIIEPFEDKSINSLDIFSTNVCALTVLLGLFIYQNPFLYFYYPCLGIMVILNCMFILTILKRILSIYMKRLERLIQNNIKKFSSKIPSFRKYLQQEKKQKIVDPKIKNKVKKIFDNYLSLTFEEKQKVKIRILKSEFNNTLSNMFGDYDDSKENDRIVKQAKPLKYKKKFNIGLNQGEEQNNLLSHKKQILSPMFSQFYSLESNINDDGNDDEENQQRRALARLLVESEIKCEDEVINKPQTEKQHNIVTEEVKGDWNSSVFYMSKNNQIVNDRFLKTEAENLSPLLLLHTESEQIKILKEDEDNDNKRATTRLQKQKDCKSENDIITNQENQEQCDVNTDTSKTDLESRDNYQSQEIKFLHSLNNQLFENQDEIKNKDNNNQQQFEESQIGESQIRESLKQDNYQVTHCQNLSPLILIHSESEQIKQNHQNEDTEQKKLQQSEINISSNIVLENRDNKSLEIKLQHSLSNEQIQKQDEVNDKQ